MDDVIFQSTPPSREVTVERATTKKATIISIHTSLAGGDISRYCWISLRAISIHTSLAGGDGEVGFYNPITEISIHTSLAGGDDYIQETFGADCISIHTSLAGGDRRRPLDALRLCLFQSTPPSREVTEKWSLRLYGGWISIHTSLAGGDRDSR